MALSRTQDIMVGMGGVRGGGGGGGDQFKGKLILFLNKNIHYDYSLEPS